jgi:anaerobic magnesium-protoporphyrin IX monomethyl ester cyclase
VTKGWIMNERLEEYDGTTAMVHSEHLPAEETEFMRWKAERWMKVHHIPVAIKHDPGFVVFKGWKMLLHPFRGSSIRSVLGLESDKNVFGRYRAIRRAEREYA